MTIGDSRCDGCQSKELFPFLGDLFGFRICACRKCAGKAVHALLRYVRGFDRDHPRRKVPRNTSRPIVDAHGQPRCRNCEAQLIAWHKTDSPYCQECQIEETERRSDGR